MTVASDPYWASSTRFYAIETPDGEKLIPGSTANIFPGLTNVLTSIPYSVLTILSLIQNWRIGDSEASRELVTKLCVYLTTFLHSLGQSFTYVIDYIDTKLSLLPEPMKVALTISGYVICAIEFVLESYKLIKQALFQANLIDIHSAPKILGETKKDIDHFIKKVEKILIKLPQESQVLIQAKIQELKEEMGNSKLEKAQDIHEKIKFSLCLKNIQVIKNQYFTLSDEEISQIAKMKLSEIEKTAKQKELLKVKAQELSRRVQPWLYNEIRGKIESSILSLESALADNIDPVKIEEAIKLNEQMRSQSKKALLIHIIALTSIGLAIGTMVACSHGIGLLLTMILLALATTGSVGTGVLKSCVLPNEGYNLRFSWILPMFIRQKYHL